MKDNGELIEFVKQKDYVMVNNNLGSGSFGQTVIIKDPFIDELFVAKKYEPYYEDAKKVFFESFLQEIKIMYKLYHPNVVRIFNYYPYESLYTGYIIMEYIDGKNISDYLYDFLEWPDNVTPDDIFLQLIDGFDYIEKQGIVHRDIREGNILVTKDGIVKIIDFGLGKTFSPVDMSIDSMANIINRSGLDCLPNEYFIGKYDSLTDMFYLAELYNRLLRNTCNENIFSYGAILRKMMDPDRNNRYQSFSEIKEAIASKDFSTLNISDHDKKVYQEFSNAIVSCLSSFTNERTFVNDISEFTDTLQSVIQKNCFEDYIQNPSDLIRVIVKGNYSYYKKQKVHCSILVTFRDWFLSLSSESQKLVFTNLKSKLSNVPISIPDEELPF